MRLPFIAAMLALGVGCTPLLAQMASRNFTYTHQLDDFTGEDRSYIMVVSEDGERAMVWRCDADGLNVLLSTGYMIGRNYQVYLNWRVDRNEPSPTVLTTQSVNHTAAFFPDNRIYPFTDEAMHGSTVVVQVTDSYDGDAERHRYSLAGLTVSLRLLPCYQPPARGWIR